MGAVVANNSQSQKAAALAAAAALSKRLTGISTSYTPPEETYSPFIRPLLPVPSVSFS